MAEDIEQLDDGIYFGLPEAEYHGQERMSSSNCQNMAVSPGDFWVDSWLNPDREPWDDNSPAALTGRAYHCARLEPKRFAVTYISEPDPADYPDALTTHTQIKEQLKELGEPQSKSGEKVIEAGLRLRAAGYPGDIWHLIVAEWQEAKGEHQIGLPPTTYKEIETDMKRLHDNPEIAPFLTDGFAEVTVLWTDKFNVRWKARIDYLQLRRVVDLKTFDNMMRKNLDKCISDAIQYNRYYLQAVIYWNAAERIREGKLPIKKCQSQAQKDLIAAIRQSEDVFEFWWIFQQKKGVPNVLARQFRMTRELHPHYAYQAPDAEGRKRLAEKLKSPSRIFEKGHYEVEHYRNLYLQCLEIWGTDKPWGVLMPVSDISDESFSSYFLES